MKQYLSKFRNYLTVLLFLLPFVSFTQVGINTTTPAEGSMLDISSTDKGVFIPRVDIVDLSNIAPITGISTPANAGGLLVYNTNTSTGPGFFVWNGGNWDIVGDNNNDWKRSGNTGTTLGTDFIGTTDSQSLEIRTNNTERMSVLANGQVSVNGAPLSGIDRFTAIGTNNESALNGYASGANGVGVYGENATTSGAAILGNVAAGYGVVGLSSSNGYGVYGQNTGAGNGVYGISDNASGFGIQASNINSSGTALVATGNNLAPIYLNSGTGLSTSGINGSFTYGRASTGTGLIATGNNSSMIVTNTNGGGIAASGTRNGVFGYAGNGNDVAANEGNAGGIFLLDTDNDINTGNNNSIRATAVLAGYDNLDPLGGASADHVYFGGYFSGGNEGIAANPSYAFVGLRYNPAGNGGSNGSTTDYKIVGTGSVSTLITDNDNTPRILFAPEAPEIVFQDYGVGQLQNGEAQIKLDPVLQKGIFVDSQHPLKVFVTLEGDCNGVYVTNKSSEGFTVKELNGGSSNVPFSWQIVASRADTKDMNGKVVSKHVGLRFPKGPKPLSPMTKQHLSKNTNIKNELKETSKNLNISKKN